MKVGIAFANSGPRAQPKLARALAESAEELGFDSLWTVEHVVVPTDYESEYPYSSSGKMPGGELPIPDPLVWLSYVAGITSRLKLGTGVLILPQRNPVYLAKEAATLDVLSGGRVMLGVGVGWLREEFAAVGVGFEDRGARTDEHIEALRALWRNEVSSFEGSAVSFSEVISSPKPARGDIPIIVGGHSEVAARRAGRLGDGFFPNRRSHEENAHLIEVMRKTAAEHGRDPDTIGVTCGSKPDLDWIRRYEDLGVARVTIAGPFTTDPVELRVGLEQFADDVLSKL